MHMLYAAAPHLAITHLLQEQIPHHVIIFLLVIMSPLVIIPNSHEDILHPVIPPKSHVDTLHPVNTHNEIIITLVQHPQEFALIPFLALLSYELILALTSPEIITHLVLWFLVHDHILAIMLAVVDQILLLIHDILDILHLVMLLLVMTTLLIGTRIFALIGINLIPIPNLLTPVPLREYLLHELTHKIHRCIPMQMIMTHMTLMSLITIPMIHLRILITEFPALSLPPILRILLSRSRDILLFPLLVDAMILNQDTPPIHDVKTLL